MVQFDLNKPPQGVEIVELKTDFSPIWKVPQELRCSLIGTCLDANEHRKMLNKNGIRSKGLELYSVHRIIMGHLYEESAFSIKVDNHLKFKYRSILADYGKATENEIREIWQKNLQSGQLDGLFYLVCVRRDLSEELLDEIFGTIHMMSHSGIHAVADSKHKLNQMTASYSKVAEQLKEQKRLNRSLIKENVRLEQALKFAEKKVGVMQDHSTQYDKAEQMSQEKEQAMVQLEQQLAEKERQYERLQLQLKKMANELDSMHAEVTSFKDLNEHLQGDIEELASHFSLLTESQASMPDGDITKLDLESKKVLIVGGMTKIKHLYQHVVESNGGQFEYHDGYTKNGNQLLDAKVSRSDIIICPVNCNSHNACNRVKKLCQKYKKPLKILSNASVSTISTALFNQEADLNSNYL